MAGAIAVDPDWIKGYASTVEQAADGLATAAQTMRATPLSAAAFGQLGSTFGAAPAYARAANTLLGQLDRAGAALRAAAGNLRTAAGAHDAADAEQAAVFTRLRQN